MEKIYAPYVLYKDDFGFISETKFLKDLNPEELLKNEGYEDTYYGKRVKIESINGAFQNGNVIFIKDCKIVEISIDDIIQKATNLFIKLAYEAINAPYMDYKRDKDDISTAEYISYMLKNFGYNVDLENKKTFDKESYLNMAKDLSHYYSISIGLDDKQKNDYLRNIKKITLALNTKIAENNGIDYTPRNAPNKHFLIDSYENENGEMEYSFKSTNSILYESKDFKSVNTIKNNKIKNLL